MGVPDVFEGRFGCGHSGTASLASVPVTKRFARIKFLQERGRCQACFQKSRAKERASEANAAAEWASAQGLPALRGTGPQIAYGEQVRKELLRESHRVLVEEGDWDEARFGDEVQEPAELISSAHWWLEQKDIEVIELPAAISRSEPLQALAWETQISAAPMQGGPGQIPWAKRIRAGKVREARARLVPASLSEDEFVATVEAPAARVNAARWWIDLEDAPAELLPELVSAAGPDAFVENVEGDR